MHVMSICKHTDAKNCVFHTHHLSPHILHLVLMPNEKQAHPLPALHYSTLPEYLRGACLPFVTLTGDIVADSGVNVLLLQIVLNRKTELLNSFTHCLNFDYRLQIFLYLLSFLLAFKGNTSCISLCLACGRGTHLQFAYVR